MTRFTCARCADAAAIRMRNSALCQGCWKAITDAGLKWCPRCQEAKPMFLDRGYCPPCRRQVDRERNGDDAYRAAKNARNRAWMARQKERAMNERCEQCGRALTPAQQHNANQCCSPACARALKQRTPRACAQCGQPTNEQRRRFCGSACAKAFRRHEARPSSPPAHETERACVISLPDPQEPAQQATGRVLGREPRGGAHYELGTVNGHLMVFEVWQGRRALYCAYSAWEGSQAWRRCHTPLPVVLPMGAEPVTAWGKRRVEEVEG